MSARKLQKQNDKLATPKALLPGVCGVTPVGQAVAVVDAIATSEALMMKLPIRQQMLLRGSVKTNCSHRRKEGIARSPKPYGIGCLVVETTF